MYQFQSNAKEEVYEYEYDSIESTKVIPATGSADLVELSYAEEVSQYTMPIEFLTNLIEITTSKEFVDEVIKLVKSENIIEIELVDIKKEIVETYKREYIQNTKIEGKRSKSETTEYKTKEDIGNVNYTVTTNTQESKYDFSVTSVDTWYVKIRKGTNLSTRENYMTINQNGEEVSIANESECISIVKEDIEENYTKEQNSNILNPSKYYKVTSEGKDTFLCSILNYTIRKDDKSDSKYSYEDYEFNKMNIKGTNVKESTLRKVTRKEQSSGVPRIEKDKTDLFLKLLKDDNNKIVKYKSLYKEEISDEEVQKEGVGAGELLVNGAEALFQLLDSSYTDENICNTRGLSDVMRYILYKYSGINYGITSLDFCTNLFGGNFNQVMGNSQILLEYVHYWESGAGGPPTNADGTKYIIISDGYGHPTVGYGVDIDNSGYKQTFIDAGYTTSIGGEVDVEFVDSIEREIRKSNITSVKAYVQGLNLKDYQLNALISRSYNMGVYGAIETKRGSQLLDFVNSYNRYWNQSTDDKFEQKDSNADFNNRLYTEYMCETIYTDGIRSTGLENRRKSEWRLFQTGYYDIINKWHSETGDFLQAADDVHNMQITWTYNSSGLYYNNIESSLNNPNKATCCATYVTCVIYKSGYASENQINTIAYNGCVGLYNYFSNAGWEKITSYDNLEPGDIVFINLNDGDDPYDHVQIYAGDNTWYNAGSTEAIQRSSPYNQGSWPRENFTIALRPVPIS